VDNHSLKVGCQVVMVVNTLNSSPIKEADTEWEEEEVLLEEKDLWAEVAWIQCKWDNSKDNQECHSLEVCNKWDHLSLNNSQVVLLFLTFNSHPSILMNTTVWPI
jgi:hypothetical protein